MPAEEDMQRHIFKFFSILSLFSCFLFIFGCSKKQNVSNERLNEVVIYAYDSFCGEWGAASSIAKKFEEKTGLKATFVDCGDGVQVLSRAVSEKDSPYADVILGIDNNLCSKAVESGILESYKAKGIENIDQNLVSALGEKNYLTPYDYSPFALIYDTKSSVPEPKCLDDLLKSEYSKKIILMNPRTSTPGLGFVAWTYAVKGEKVFDYWEALKPNILTMAPGWSAGYGLFTEGEAPLVISYTTSPSYHYEYDNTDRYKALVFDEGHVMQVEGIGLSKNAPNKKGGQLFIDFMISEEAQNELPLTQWMIPVNKNVVLPDSYKKGTPQVSKILSYDTQKVNECVEKIMNVLEK